MRFLGVLAALLCCLAIGETHAKIVSLHRSRQSSVLRLLSPEDRPPVAPLHDSFVECTNGGKIDGDECICPIYYTAEDCSKRQCPNSVGGTEPFDILPVHPITQKCDHCRTEDYTGFVCQLCQRDSACAKYAGNKAVCDRSIAIRGDNKQFQCKLNSPYFVELLGGGRDVTADVVLNCTTPDETAFSEGNQGVCEFAIYRIEPHEEYIDPFFRCTTSACNMKYELVKKRSDDGTKAQIIFRWLRIGGQVILVLLSVSLAVLGGFVKHLGHKRIKNITFTLGVCIVCTVIVFIALMMASMHPTEVEHTVVYDCKKTTCACAEDPPQRYTPICSQTSILADSILPSIKNDIHLVCSPDTNKCQLTLSDLSLVFDVDCQASECVDESRFPLPPPDDADHLSSQQLTMRILLCLVSTLLVGLVIHFLYMRRHADIRAREFVIIFSITAPRTDDEGLSTTPPEEEEEENSCAHLLFPSDGVTFGPLEQVASPAPHSILNMDAVHPPTVVEVQDDLPDEHDQPLPPNITPHAPQVGNRRDSVVTIRESIGRRAAQLTLEERMKIERVRQLTRSPLELSVDHLRYVLESSRLVAQDEVGDRVILNQISFTVRSGEVLAIMGPSGAGKTTLLDLLSARTKSGRVGGRVLLNGTPIQTTDGRDNRYRNILGYVSQEDTLLPALTVRQTIEFAARLKLPKAFSTHTIAKTVDRMIAALKLQQCEHTLVGDGSSLRGISGGEKRRVSIAVELLANPRILFLDEPTSGLDSISAMRVVEAVVELSKDSPMRRYAPHYFAFRPMVIFSIHQPSKEIFELFDKILLLSRGVSVYCGMASCAAEVLESRLNETFGRIRAIPPREEHSNPAEYLMKLEEVLDYNVRAELQVWDATQNSTQSQTLLATLPVDSHCAGSSRHGDGSLSTMSAGAPSVSMVDGESILSATIGFRVYYANVYQQLALLTSRSVACLIGSFHLVVCHSAVVACLASLMCFLYHEQALDLPGALNRAGSVSFLLLVTSFVSLSCLEQLVLERKLLVVERENGFYSTFPYLLSKVGVDIIPLRVIPATVLASVIYFPMGFRTDSGEHFLWFIFIIVLFSISVTLLVLCIGIISGGFGAAALLSSVFILWNFVFGGAMVQAETIPALLVPFKDVSPFFLAFESLMVNELYGQACVFSPTDETGKPSSTSIPIMCVQYLANIGLKPQRFNTDVIQLVFYCFFLVMLAWLLLATCTKIVR